MLVAACEARGIDMVMMTPGHFCYAPSEFC